MYSISPYAELHCVSNFSFLRGASHAEELVDRARELDYSALAVTDECSLAGVVRAHLQARESRFPLLIGAEFSAMELLEEGVEPPHPDDGDAEDFSGVAGVAGVSGVAGVAGGSGRKRRRRSPAVNPAHSIAGHFGVRLATPRLVLLARNRNGYGNLSQLITRARRRSPKGHYRLLAQDLHEGLEDCLALWVPRHGETEAALLEQSRWLRERFGGQGWLAAELLTLGDDLAWLDRLKRVERKSGVRLVAAGDVHFHVRSRKSLQDTLTAIQLNEPVAEAGFALAPNAEQHLRSRLRLSQIYPARLMEETLEIASRCTFSLEELRYEYPEEIVPAAETPASWLKKLTIDGSRIRFPEGLPEPVRKQISYELELISELRYEPYFLTVADIVRHARSQGILCQGRGSAANSAVCYCLGITEVDPSRTSVLFERFISKERNEPPDIDVDFEHQRREEVMQYIYEKYGRDRAALTATVICYRARSAVRDVGKALGIDLQRIDQLTRNQQWWDGRTLREDRLREAGFDPDSPVVQHWMSLAAVLMTFPRHLSQHTGGFVIARDSLSRLVPIENAAMVDRSVIQWDKDDLDALGLLKIDVLALGMLSAIRRALDLIGRRRQAVFRIQDVPAEDPETYDMICRADTVGVFQIESRAQMSMLPRLQPRRFYDLVIEVAIVRPGPIQGGMVHPYLRRRQGLEAVEYPRDEIKPALERTLGVPIFQEQVMQVAIMAAGFTPGEADQLRRSITAWKRKGGLHHFQEKVIGGMLARGYDLDFAQRLFAQIEGFAGYGFPESHAASFALLVYVSCWIKRHEPAAFLAALLNSQPMGFYAPAQLVRDAREHGIAILPVDVLVSDWDSTLEESTTAAASVSEGVDYRPQPAVRLGLNRVRGLSEAAGRRILASRNGRTPAPPVVQMPDEALPWRSVEDMALRARLNRHDLQVLAGANALGGLAGHRINAAWQVSGIQPMPDLLEATPFDEAPLDLPAPTEAEDTFADYRSLGIPMGRHPLALLRSQLSRFHVVPAEVLRTYPHGRLARASGLVTHRQRPETASGVVFLTLEDDTGAVNVIVWPNDLERYRKAVLGGNLLTVYGTWQRDTETGGQVMNLLAKRIVDHSHLLGELATRSRDFR